MKKRLLLVVFALIVLTFTALLAFLPSVFGIHPKPAPVTATTPTATATTPPAAKPVVPVAKKPSPATKTTIMGTPAQLVEDLKSMGLDIVNANYTDPNLLKESTVEVVDRYAEYVFSNGHIRYSENRKEFVGFVMDSPFLPESEKRESVGSTSQIPLGQFKDVFIEGKTELIKRYGTEFGEIDDTRIYKTAEYNILVESEPRRLWKTTFVLDDRSNVSKLYVSVTSRNPYRIYVSYAKGSVKLSGEGTKIYEDLIDCGLTLGIPSTNFSAISNGEARSANPDITAYTFQNGSVSIETKTRRVKTFFLAKPKPSFEDIKETIRDRFGRKAVLNSGRILATYNAGPDAVIKRYGKCEDLRYQQPPYPNFAYRLIIDEGTGPQFASISFGYGEYDYPGIVGLSIFGNPLYIYTPPALPNPK